MYSQFDKFSDDIKTKIRRPKLAIVRFLMRDNGKELLLKTLKQVYQDIHSETTILWPKRGDFTTTYQKNGLGDSRIFNCNSFTIDDFVFEGSHDKTQLQYAYKDVIIRFRALFNNKDDFNKLYSFYEKNYDSFKNNTCN